jgi:DME family drug/metabolite transporter
MRVLDQATERRWLPQLLVLAAAVLFSTGGAAIKACSLTGWQVASLRSAVAAVALLLLLPKTRHNMSLRAALVGIAYASTLILFVRANKLTTAANTIFLQSAAPLYLLMLSPWLLRERATRRDLAFMLVFLVGLGLIATASVSTSRSAPDPVSGNRLALLSGVTWALTLAGLRWMGKREGPSGGLAAVVFGNLLTAFIAAWPAFPAPAISMRDLAILLYLGLFQIGLAYVLLTKAMPHVPAIEVSLLVLLEPALNPVWVWLVHGEQVGVPVLAGGFLIIGATALKSWIDSRGTSAAA